MGSLGIVKCHPILDDASGLEAVPDFFDIDRLLLEAALYATRTTPAGWHKMTAFEKGFAEAALPLPALTHELDCLHQPLVETSFSARAQPILP